MKKLVLVLMALMLATGAIAQVKWVPIETAAKTDTKNNQKLFFVDFSSSWCGWCKKLDKETFSDATVSKILNKYYVPVKFDAEGKSEFSWNGTKYANAQNTTNGRPSTHAFTRAVLGQKIGYPSCAFFTPDMKLITINQGYVSAEEFVVILWYFASGDYQKYAFEKYQQIFNKEIRPSMNKQLK